MADVMERQAGAPAELPAEALESALVSWASTMAASEYRWLRLVAEHDERRLYERWECRSCAHWLMWHCGLDLRAAHEKVRVARALARLPVVAAAFERGELSYSKVRAVTRVAHPGIEAALVETARSIHTAGLERIVAGIRRARVLNEPDRPEHQPAERRSVTYRHEDDGTVVVVARLPAEEHALLAKAIDAMLDPAGGRRVEQRRADALVEVAARSLATGGTATSTADRYQVVVRVDAAVLADPAEGTGECHLDGGGTIAAETARRLSCDGSVVRLHDDHDGAPAAISAKTRTVPAALRRALRARDQHCQFPGCTHRAWLDAHHCRHWIDGGPTQLDNLLLVCRRHHRAVHERGWTVTRAPGRGWTFTNPHGWALDPPAPGPHHIDPDVPGVRPDAITPHWYDRPDLRYIVSVFSDAPPDPTWN